MIIDSHCHLDYEPLVNNIDQVLLNAKNNNIISLLTIGTSLESSKKVLDIVDKYPNVYGAIGIHPNSTSGNLEKRNVIIYVVLDFMRKISILLQPIIPEKSKIILDSLNVNENERFLTNINKNFSLKQNTKIQKINILFKKQ